MLVKLARSWFDPDGNLRETRFNPHEISDAWKDILPPGADVLDEKGNVVKAAPDEDKKLDELSKDPVADKSAKK